jgi:hypothetical protein
MRSLSLFPPPCPPCASVFATQGLGINKFRNLILNSQIFLQHYFSKKCWTWNWLKRLRTFLFYSFLNWFINWSCFMIISRKKSWLRPLIIELPKFWQDFFPFTWFPNLCCLFGKRKNRFTCLMLHWLLLYNLFMFNTVGVVNGIVLL